jgi:hypothetical protein
MKQSLKVRSFYKTVFFVLFSLCGILYSSRLAAQDAQSQLPDDSILVAENYIDSIPEKYTKEKIQKLLEKYIEDWGFRYDYFEQDGVKGVVTFKKDISKDLKYFDREVDLILVYVLTDDNKLWIRAYSAEKLKSTTHNFWAILSKKTKTRVLNYEEAMRKNLKKRFR